MNGEKLFKKLVRQKEYRHIKKLNAYVVMNFKDLVNLEDIL